jgi:hypothetical protein
MRIANVAGRLVLMDTDDRAVDVGVVSEGRFGTHPQAIYARWTEFRAWAATETFDEAQVRSESMLIASRPTLSGFDHPRRRTHSDHCVRVLSRITSRQDGEL